MADEPLREYRRKRRPQDTPEPAGDRPAKAASRRRPKAPAPPRFSIQEHSATRLHWDLRLEHDGVLVSFAIPNGLPVAPGSNHLAVHTEDHPLEYLTFHGRIPAGNYGAGTMELWDTGTYEVLKWEPRKIEVHLHGERVDARYALFPIDKGPEPKDWMVHRMDPPADPDAEPMPSELVPMLARPGALPPDDGRWAFEVKWDGVRALAFSEPGRLRLVSRNANDITSRYPELARFNRALHHHRAILDGEVVAFDAQGRPSFSALQRRMHVADERKARRLADAAPVTYVVFDLLWLDGHPLMDLPYLERRARLTELVQADPEHPRWQVPEHVTTGGQALLDAARAQGLEGVIAKRTDALYEPGRRSPNWIKVKVLQRQELVIGGWLPGEGRRRDRIGALLVGVPEDGGLRYAGRVGTGFTQAELERLAALLGPLEQDESPFDPASVTPRGQGSIPRERVFVRPEQVCEVAFAQWSPDGKLRHPSYQGLRTDKRAAEVGRETTGLAVRGDRTRKAGALGTIDGVEVKLSNLDKVLYPAAGFTKRDVLDYLIAIAPVLLPHLAGRPLTLKRYPGGVEDEFFYEKNAPSHRPDWVTTAKVGPIRYVIADSVPTLVWLGNLADLELHTSLSRAPDMAHPTAMAFDLDPGPPATVVECCEVALLLHGMLGQLGLTSCAKTSGNKGLQVYVPLDGQATYDDTKAFSKAVAELLAAEVGHLVVARQAKQLRPGKVLVDWFQNDEAKTTVNVYSLRAREQPTVSTPVTWEEVQACRDAGDPALLRFTAPQVLERVARDGDLFAPVLSVRQALPRMG